MKSLLKTELFKIYGNYEKESGPIPGTENMPSLESDRRKVLSTLTQFFISNKNSVHVYNLLKTNNLQKYLDATDFPA
jgi:hypothetical protein